MHTELVLGTCNPAKVRYLRGILAQVGVSLRGAQEWDLALDVAETGGTAQENARLKAVAFAERLGRTVLSMDNALYLGGLPANEQPGLHVRRIGPGAVRASDQQVLEHYARIVDRQGGVVEGHWEFGLALAGPEGPIADTVVMSPCRWMSPPSPRRTEGYPLESIQVDPVSGRHLVDLDSEARDALWRQSMGASLIRFIQEHLP